MDIDVKHAGGGVYEISAHVDVPVPVRDAYNMHFDATRFRDIRWFERVDVVSSRRLLVEYTTGAWLLRRRVSLVLDHAASGPGAHVSFASTPLSGVKTSGTWTMTADGRGGTAVSLTCRVHAPRLPGARALVCARVRRALEDMLV
jgi:hypothetical protein